jgi:ATP-dependent exoDNAse (exonuclease V) beta subunit
MSFTVYKSSAGSGKTYTLVREYLAIVLRQPSLYRNVLAITFTNKAANEMKERIVSVLKQISQYDAVDGQGSLDLLVKHLLERTGLDRTALVKNSQIVLDDIIHNYSEFAVSTIDSFVHRLIRSFSFDLNVPVNFDVEMDTDEVLRQVVDVMISRAGSDEDLTNFLVDFVRTRSEEDQNWNIESDLLKVARLLKKEESIEHLQRNAGLELKDYMLINASINKYIAQFEAKLQSLGVLATDIIAARGIEASAFYQGARGVVGYFQNLASNKFDKILPNSYVQATIAENKWTSGKATEADREDILGIQDEMVRIYQDIQLQIEEDQQNYILFREIRKTLYPLAILDKINQVLEEYKSDHEILLIAEFNQIVSSIVSDQPVPFIYERVGEKYRHFLLDEFQDTSVLQWQNLLPLIHNSLGGGFDNLVVGDAKQAIYRWRNGEVEQFVRLPRIHNRKPGQVHLEREKALQDHYHEQSLNTNYRSRPGIVEFNNRLFTHLADKLSEADATIYQGVSQEPLRSNTGGYIQVEFYPPGDREDSFESFNCDRILDIIKDAKGAGYRSEEVAILCRTNAAAAIIAGFLLGRNIQVVSSESVLLANAPRVRLIVAMLTLLLNPDDGLAAVELTDLLLQVGLIPGDFHSASSEAVTQKKDNENGIKGAAIFRLLGKHGFPINRSVLLSLPLYDLCETLIRLFAFQEQADPFVQFFLDVVLEQEKESQSGVRKFLEYWYHKKGSLSIVVPETLDAVRIMTIHKAKGLEFPVVICPFIKESLSKTIDTVWLNLDNERIPNLKAAMVRANKTIQDTRYGYLVDRELEKSKLDIINLLYVAFTRPTDGLYIIANHPQNLRSSANSVPALLLEYLTDKDGWREQVYRYCYGSKTTPGTSPGQSVHNFYLSKTSTADWRSRALISYQAPSNWEVDEPGKSQEWGNLIHKVLSEVFLPEDLGPVLDQYQYTGIIDAQERQLLFDLIMEFLGRPEVSAFFKPGLTIFSEKDIVTPGGKIFRPDRIVAEGDQVFVIDFKTGVVREKHSSQMRGYLHLLTEMGWPSVKGVVLYLDEKEPLYVS